MKINSDQDRERNIYGQASGVSSPPPPNGMVWRGGAGGGQERAGLPGLLGPSLHPNLDTKALQNPEPRPESLVCCSMIWQNIACYSILQLTIAYYSMP